MTELVTELRDLQEIASGLAYNAKSKGQSALPSAMWLMGMAGNLGRAANELEEPGEHPQVLSGLQRMANDMCKPELIERVEGILDFNRQKDFKDLMKRLEELKTVGEPAQAEEEAPAPASEAGAKRWWQFWK
jgi:hypothetical protein